MEEEIFYRTVMYLGRSEELGLHKKSNTPIKWNGPEDKIQPFHIMLQGKLGQGGMLIVMIVLYKCWPFDNTREPAKKKS